MRLGCLASLLAILVSPAVVSGQAPPPPTDAPPTLAQRIGITGSLRGGYWSSSRNLEEGEHFAGSALWLKAAPKPWPKASLLIEGWVRNQDLFHEDATDGALREAYFDASLRDLDLRIGKQLIVWGRADRINPTDNLTPRDFTLLVPEDDDQRLGAVAAKATYYVGGVALTGIWLPHFDPHTIPIGRRSGVTIRERLPQNTLAQGAARIEQTGKAVDWSLSYYDGFDLFPDIALDQVRDSGEDLVLRHHRIRVIGADAATTVGRYGLRAEAAYTFTEDSRGADPRVKNPFFSLVAGGDRTFFEYLNVNLQYLFHYVVRHRSPSEILDPVERSVAIEQAGISNQFDRVQHGLSLRVSHKWLNETLEGEVAAVVLFARLDYVVRPKLLYALTDRWKLTVGADIFRGEPQSFLGRLRDNSTAYAELRWSF
ncbi:MAG: hypothetical protein HY215_02930 [Candidatus Rokubacteria bacterium]|nr:hypothetical protein [Candidatus Rokubacteria bacterium]